MKLLDLGADHRRCDGHENSRMLVQLAISPYNKITFSGLGSQWRGMNILGVGYHDQLAEI